MGFKADFSGRGFIAACRIDSVPHLAGWSYAVMQPAVASGHACVEQDRGLSAGSTGGWVLKLLAECL